jgi:hypothetical protein
LKTAAKIISYFFHPLLLATYLVLMLGLFFPSMLMIGPGLRNLFTVTLFIFGFTFVIPAANIYLFKILGNISSLQLESRKERKLPFVFISIMYAVVAYLFESRLPFNSNFNKLLILIAALVVVATVLTFFFKVSVHSLAMGGWVGILLPLLPFSPSLLWPTAFVIAITGVVISSRLVLNSHTSSETFIGATTGLVVGYLGMIVLF